MLTLVLNRLCVIFYCASILPLLAESVTSVVVKVRFVRVQLDCPGETLNRLLKITLSVKRNAHVVVSESISSVDSQSCLVVIDSFIITAHLVIRETSIEKRFEVLRHDKKRFCIELDGLGEITLFSCVEPCCMIFLSSYFELFVVLTDC